MAEATQPRTAPVPGPTLEREMGPIAILFSSVGVVIGSGWLLGAYHATLIAGPAAIAPWLIGVLVISYLGSFQAGAGTDGIPDTHLAGGNHTPPFGVDMIVMAVWSLVIYYLAVPVRLSKEKAQQYIVDPSSGELITEAAE